MNSIMASIYNLVDNSVLETKNNNCVSFKLNNAEFIFCINSIKNQPGTFQLSDKNCHVIFLFPIMQNIKIECITMLALSCINVNDLQITTSEGICTLGVDIFSCSNNIQAKWIRIRNEKRESYQTDYAKSLETAIRTCNKQGILDNIINATQEIFPEFVNGERIDVERVLQFWKII